MKSLRTRGWAEAMTGASSVWSTTTTKGSVSWLAWSLLAVSLACLVDDPWEMSHWRSLEEIHRVLIFVGILSKGATVEKGREQQP